MMTNERFFSKFMIAIAMFGSMSLVCDFASAAARTTTTRSAPTTAARKNVTTTKATSSQGKVLEQAITPEKNETIIEPVVEQVEEPILVVADKSNQFESTISAMMESAAPDNSFAMEIRRQRAALEMSEATSATASAQQRDLATNSHACDVALRKCMSGICGSDFTKCATDGDTIFGDKLNKCRKDTECTTEEFSLFTKEIKADRDTNVKLASYNAVLDCGNKYNACIINECGTTYNKCLGKTAENAAIQKCSIIAAECKESDSGLAARFGTVIGKLRENAETDIKTDEKRLYELRDLMATSCKSLGATFDERSFDCVYTVNFYAGANQSAPLASRKAYAGDSFICTQEWFGINATTYKENAYRETRAQTAASSAMLGSGLGTAAGTISSGAIDRAIETTKAKKASDKAANAEDKAQDEKNREENKTINKAKRKENSAIVAKSAEVTAEKTNNAVNDMEQELSTKRETQQKNKNESSVSISGSSGNSGENKNAYNSNYGLRGRYTLTQTKNLLQQDSNVKKAVINPITSKDIFTDKNSLK